MAIDLTHTHNQQQSFLGQSFRAGAAPRVALRRQTAVAVNARAAAGGEVTVRFSCQTFWEAATHSFVSALVSLCSDVLCTALRRSAGVTFRRRCRRLVVTSRAVPPR